MKNILLITASCFIASHLFAQAGGNAVSGATQTGATAEPTISTVGNMPAANCFGNAPETIHDRFQSNQFKRVPWSRNGRAAIAAGTTGRSAGCAE